MAVEQYVSPVGRRYDLGGLHVATSAVVHTGSLGGCRSKRPRWLQEQATSVVTRASNLGGCKDNLGGCGNDLGGCESDLGGHSGG